MNGVHDMGGMHGFGRVQREEDEPVFHQPWEGRVYGMTRSHTARAGFDRFALERMEPSRYLAASYYERWLVRFESVLVEKGVLTQQELDDKQAYYAAHPDDPVPRREDVERCREVLANVREPKSPVREIDDPPRFQIGDVVRTRDVHPTGHTRLPRYARGKRCKVVRYHGWQNISGIDATVSAASRGEPFPLYTVLFAARELWGESAQSNAAVCLDMWEPYLEDAVAGLEADVTG